jgi:L-rhamnose isomerase / sugar isomerase
LAGALDQFKIELPSWSFANAGTSFGKFMQPAATNLTEIQRRPDGQSVNWSVPDCRPSYALGSAQWTERCVPCKRAVLKCGVAAGSIDPNLFQEQEYKFGAVGNPDPSVRKKALDHLLGCVAIADRLDSRDVAPWFPDGSSYLGMRHRIGLV